MRNDYGNRLGVALSVRLLPRNLPHTSFTRQKQAIIGFFMVFQGFCCVTLAEYVLFKSSGIVWRSLLLSLLPDELPIDRKRQ